MLADHVLQCVRHTRQYSGSKLVGVRIPAEIVPRLQENFTALQVLSIIIAHHKQAC
jgi:hypothetical protein